MTAAVTNLHEAAMLQTSHKKDDRTISKNAELRKKFDAIVVGDLMSNGDGGTSLTDVEKSLSKPVSTSTTNLQNVKVKDDQNMD